MVIFFSLLLAIICVCCLWVYVMCSKCTWSYAVKFKFENDISICKSNDFPYLSLDVLFCVKFRGFFFSFCHYKFHRYTPIKMYANYLMFINLKYLLVSFDVYTRAGMFLIRFFFSSSLSLWICMFTFCLASNNKHRWIIFVLSFVFFFLCCYVLWLVVN